MEAFYKLRARARMQLMQLLLAVKVSNVGGSEVAREQFLTVVDRELNLGPSPITKIYTRHLLDITSLISVSQ